MLDTEVVPVTPAPVPVAVDSAWFEPVTAPELLEIDAVFPLVLAEAVVPATFC